MDEKFYIRIYFEIFMKIEYIYYVFIRKKIF